MKIFRLNALIKTASLSHNSNRHAVQYKKAGGNLATNGSRFTGLLFTLWRNVTSGNRPLRLARNFSKSDESWNPDYGWLKVTENYPIEFVSHASYSLLLIGIQVIAPLTRLATERPDRPVSPTPLVFNAPGGGPIFVKVCVALPRCLMYKIV